MKRVEFLVSERTYLRLAKTAKKLKSSLKKLGEKIVSNGLKAVTV